MANFTVSPAGLRLMERFEGFRETPYALPDGRFVVGFGHVSASAAPMTRAQARVALAADANAVGARVNELFPVGLTQTRFDALVSLAHSIGWAAFEASDVVRRLQAGDAVAAALAMLAWRKRADEAEGEVCDALVRRRIAEQAHFLCDDEAEAAPPSLALRPALDHACAILGAPTHRAPINPRAPAAAEAPLLLTQRVEDDAPPHAVTLRQRVAAWLNAVAPMRAARAGL
ncbi:MAG: lysozyme [Hyphomonadaceae bacterium]|nr:lysozyme [Hyphomonadaceae bacterium]